jgi:hypothetical protein
LLDWVVREEVCLEADLEIIPGPDAALEPHGSVPGFCVLGECSAGENNASLILIDLEDGALLVDLEKPGEQILILASSILVERRKLDAGWELGLLGELGVELSLKGGHLGGESLASALELLQLGSQLGHLSLMGGGLWGLSRRGCWL